jgi:RND family efflux transporter MFP subunit
VLLVAAVVVAIILVGLLIVGVIPRMENGKELKRMEATTSGAVPVVHTIKAEAAPYEESGILPGSIGAMQYANIYARVDGYLKSRFVDIGSVVKTGELLAEIDTPTIDENLKQSQADLAQAKAQLKSANSQLKEAQAQLLSAKAVVERTQSEENLAAITATRWKNMADKGAVTLQSRDEKVSTYAVQTASLKASVAQETASESAVSTAQSQVQVAEAQVSAKQANVRYWLVQQSFKRVLAPFDGVITLRKVDPGALITAGSQSSSLELFQMAKLDVVRTYINVPQSVASLVRPGQTADLLLAEFPGRVFAGTIACVSGALDPNTRTRQTEVRVNNQDHILLPGMYAQVKIKVRQDDPWVKVAGTTLVPRGNGMYVVVVKDNKASYRKVDIGRDFGDQVEIKYGLHAGDEVAVSPPIDLKEGESVKPVALASE